MQLFVLHIFLACAVSFQITKPWNIKSINIPSKISGNSHLQFWLLAVCKNIGKMPGDTYDVICGTGITCCHTYMYSHSWQKTILATKIRQALTENNVRSMKHIWAGRNTSKSLPNHMCEISATPKFTDHNRKEAFLQAFSLHFCILQAIKNWRLQ